MERPCATFGKRLHVIDCGIPNWQFRVLNPAVLYIAEGEEIAIAVVATRAVPVVDVANPLEFPVAALITERFCSALGTGLRTANLGYERHDRSKNGPTALTDAPDETVRLSGRAVGGESGHDR
jgi:hypothetical protein